MSARTLTIVAAAAALLAIATDAHCSAARAAITPASLFNGPLGPPEAIVCRSDPRARLETIADLLIDGRPEEAKAAARELLASENLGPREAARAHHLLAKAEALLPPPPPPPPASPPSFPAASFPVREAQVGGGFSAGTTGSLRLADTGVSFLAVGGSEAAWTLRWNEVIDLSRDEGVWDAEHPLVLRRRGGAPYYLALIDGQGDDVPPDRLLSAFAGARREAERRRASAADEPAATPGKEQPR